MSELSFEIATVTLTLTMLCANSADDKLMIFFLFFLENRIWHFMQNVSFWKIGSDISCRQFAWSAESYFQEKIWKVFQNVVCWNFYPVMIIGYLNLLILNFDRSIYNLVTGVDGVGWIIDSEDPDQQFDQNLHHLFQHFRTNILG